jgi:hypothetical protein
MQNTAVDLGDIRWLSDALFELDVLVPEWVALEVEADEVGTALEQTARSAFESRKEGGVGGGGLAK